MSNPNKIHYSRGYTSIGGVQFNPKLVVGVILVLFSLYAVYKYGQFAAEKNFNMEVQGPRTKSHVELLSWSPRVFYHHNFLTPSEVASLKDGFANTTRSQQSWVGNGQWFDSLKNRIARFTQEPTANFELFFFSRYDPGVDSEPKRDWFKESEKDLIGNIGNRVATLIMFITPPHGGEFYFPQANLRVTPKTGDAILVWNLTPDHRIDELAQYGVRNVASGVMLTYSVYIRERAV